MNFSDIVHKRRSINFFDTEKDVSEDLLGRVISLAAQAPSSFNLQPWNVVAVRDGGKKEKLQELAWGQPKVSEAPVTLIVLGDMDGWKEGHATLEYNWRQMLDTGSMGEEQRGWFLDATRNLYGSSEEAVISFAAKNAGFFSMALMYAATSFGLETHPMDGFDREGVKKAFKIPDNYWLPLLIAVGYPKPGLELHPPKWRKTAGDILVNFE